MICITIAILVISTVVASPCKITRDVFGSYAVPERGGKQGTVYRYTLSNGQVTAQVVDYGATLTSVRLPGVTGHEDDVVLGFDTLEGYQSAKNPYFGASIGRVANRIAGGQFTLDGITYKLYQNDGNSSLHGGLRGFDKKLWASRVDNGKVVMSYASQDGEEGYPGQLDVEVTYSLTPDSSLIIEYKASSSKKTPINLINHAYFNLAGHATGAETLYNHSVTIMSDYITETRSDLIPTGRSIAVLGSPWDFKKSTRLGDAIKLSPNNGFDDNFVLQKQSPRAIVAVVWDPSSGRRLEVRTSQPGLQFYTSNSLAPVLGKGQARYSKHAAFCLEAQNFPDAVNHPKEFPNSVYGPEDNYHQVIEYKFVEPETNKCIKH